MTSKNRIDVRVLLLITGLWLGLDHGLPAISHEHRKYGPIPAEDPLRETYQGYSAALQNAAKINMTPEQLLAFNRDYYKLIASRNDPSEMMIKAIGIRRHNLEINSNRD